MPSASTKPIVAISGSTSATSRTAKLLARVVADVEGRGYKVETIRVRDLPAEDLVQARFDSLPLQEATAKVEGARAIIVATPIYKAAYSGILKAFLDVLPQFGLAQKTVLPLATGGTIAHVLAIDYALRPVLNSLGARHIVPGLFVLDKSLALTDDGGVLPDEATQKMLDGIVGAFLESIAAFER